MHVPMRFAALAGAGCLLLVGAVACGDRNADSATAPVDATASQAENESTQTPTRAEQASDTSGDCGTIERNYTTDEIIAVMDIGVGEAPTVTTAYDDPELYTTIVADTPAEGQQEYLDSFCARILEDPSAWGGTEELAEELVKQFSDTSYTQLAALIGPGYTACYEMAATGGPLSVQVPFVLPVDPADANEYLCPQVSFPS